MTIADTGWMLEKFVLLALRKIDPILFPALAFLFVIVAVRIVFVAPAFAQGVIDKDAVPAEEAAYATPANSEATTKQTRRWPR